MGQNWPRRKLGAYRRNARRRSIAFLLPESRAIGLFRGQCYYCGAKPHKNRKEPNLLTKKNVRYFKVKKKMPTKRPKRPTGARGLSSYSRMGKTRGGRFVVVSRR